MKLSELLKNLVTQKLPDVTITGLHNDSRQCQPGFVFLACPGVVSDGRNYLAEAVSAGATVILFEPHNWPAGCVLPQTVTCIPLPGLADKLPILAAQFYARPSSSLSVTGVTGTNGKTTIAFQLAQAHAALSEKAAYIGTLGEGDPFALNPLVNTTPGALCLQKLLHDYKLQKRVQVCMEVSSHALAQHRVNGIDFRQAIFTNLTLDHLDFHQSMDNYAAAKAQLFAQPTLEWAIINQDDDYAGIMRDALLPSCKLMTYGVNSECDVRAVSWQVSLKGTEIRVHSPWGMCDLQISALGFFNVYNALAIFTSLMLHGYKAAEVIKVMKNLRPAPGRMEVVNSKPYILVDYAHTPDALENVLVTLGKVKEGKILVVFGCGGDRDKSKRPVMGNIAARHADIAIMTNDNPRNEDPLQIMQDIEKGIINKDHLFKIPDREQAIAKALSLASPQDIIVVAGKGHEAYQQIGDVKHAFSDQEVIIRLVRNCG